jgi:hypothetical protein
MQCAVVYALSVGMPAVHHPLERCTTDQAARGARANLGEEAQR